MRSCQRAHVPSAMVALRRRKALLSGASPLTKAPIGTAIFGDSGESPGLLALVGQLL